MGGGGGGIGVGICVPGLVGICAPGLVSWGLEFGVVPQGLLSA